LRALQNLEAQDAALAARGHQLRTWQCERLAHTYADLAADPAQAPALQFFLTDLYGPHDFHRRDQDLTRAAAILERTLPRSALGVLLDALELNVLSTELDHELAQALAPGPISPATYAQAYRRAGRFPDRRRQIELIVRVGEQLARTVEQPLIGVALRAARTPAYLAGFGTLQEFLARGLRAFSRLGGASSLLETIRARESALSETLEHGVAAAHPVPATPVSMGTSPRRDAALADHSESPPEHSSGGS
jgi:hypothetical protein